MPHKKYMIFALVIFAVIAVGVFAYFNLTKNSNPMLKHNPSDYYSGESLQVALAIRSGDDKALDSLLVQSPSLAASRGEKNLPLLAWAMGHNSPEAFKRLLDAGAPPDDFFMVGEAKMSLLSLATGAEDSQWLELLLTYKANPNGLPETEPPLVTAFFAHKMDRFKLLLKAGADINHPDELGITVILDVAISRDYQTALELVKLGADVNAQSDDGKISLRNIIDRYPLEQDAPQGQAQAELARMLK